MFQYLLGTWFSKHLSRNCIFTAADRIQFNPVIRFANLDASSWQHSTNPANIKIHVRPITKRNPFQDGGFQERNFDDFQMRVTGVTGIGCFYMTSQRGALWADG